MKKIQFSNHIFKNQTINIYDNIGIIVGESGSGKTTILNTLEKGFQGKVKDFYIDDDTVDNDTYQVLYLRECFNLKDTLKLTKTSSLRGDLIRYLNKEIINSNEKKFKDITNNLENVHTIFNKLLNDGYFNKINKDDFNSNLQLQSNLEVFSLNNIIDKFLKIQIVDIKTNSEVDEDSYSQFMMRILLFNILKNSFELKDKLRSLIILFDLPELYGTPKILFELNKVLNKFMEESVTIIIVSNSPQYLNSLKAPLNSINLIKESQINNIKYYDKIIRDAVIFFSFWESKQQDLSMYKSQLNALIDNSDILNEEKYIEKHIYEKIINSLFAEEILLTINNNKALKKEVYTIELFDSVRNLIFICIILLKGFGVVSNWDLNNIDNNQVLSLYLN